MHENEQFRKHRLTASWVCMTKVRNCLLFSINECQYFNNVDRQIAARRAAIQDVSHRYFSIP